MTTITQEFERLAQSVNQTLTTQHQQLQLQQAQMKSLSQLLNASMNSSLDRHCISAIERLSELLDRHQQTNTQVYNVLSTLTQAKDAQNLTINSQGEIATCLILELGELAQRLKIDQFTKLSTAAHNVSDWTKLMTTHPDPDGYQWQCPKSKRGFYHNTHLQVTGTKTVNLNSIASNN
jgi:hypothetical protein